MMRSGIVRLALLLTAALSVPAMARDVDHERLSRSLAELEANTALAVHAGGEIAAARAALVRLEEDARGKKRVHALYMAERRLDIAWAAGQLGDLANRQRELQREHDRLLLAAARRDAELARRELERQRLLAQIRAEEAEQAALDAETARALGEQATAAALEEAEQSRRVAEAQAQEASLARKEAELASAAADALRVRLENLRATRGAAGMQMTIEDIAFGSGRSTLRAEARESLGAVVEFVNREPDKLIRIEGHTDSTGSANANLALSQKRAEAVRDALVAEGVDAARIRVVGIGSERAVASNATVEGRSKNRRVDVILEDKQ